MSVLRSLLSLGSVTLICCLMISAEVIGRLSLATGDDGDVDDIFGLDPAQLGDNGFDPQELERLDDGERFSIFNPNAFLTLLVTAIPTPGGLAGEPGLNPCSSPLPSEEL